MNQSNGLENDFGGILYLFEFVDNSNSSLQSNISTVVIHAIYTRTPDLRARLSFS